jgi:hypothetical protein
LQLFVSFIGAQVGSSSGTIDRRNVKEIVIKNASDPMFGTD